MINVASSRLVEQSLDSSDTFIDSLLDRSRSIFQSNILLRPTIIFTIYIPGPVHFQALCKIRIVVIHARNGTKIAFVCIALRFSIKNGSALFEIARQNVSYYLSSGFGRNDAIAAVWTEWARFLQESPLTFIRILAIVLEATTSIEADGSIPFDRRYLCSLFSR